MKYLYKFILSNLICSGSLLAMSSNSNQVKNQNKPNITNSELGERLISAINRDDNAAAQILIACGVDPISAILPAAKKNNNLMLETVFSVKNLDDMTYLEKVKYDEVITQAVNAVIFNLLENQSNFKIYIKTIENLLQAGANPNYVLVQLAYYHLPQLGPIIIKYIKNSKYYNLNAKINDKTTLWLASQDSEICKMIVSSGANINAQNYNDGETVLMRFSRFGDVDMVDYLIENSADLDMQDIAGSTALMIATKYCQRDVVAKLILKKANKNLTDKYGKTALEIAKMKCENSSTEIVIAQYELIKALLA